MQGAPDSIPGSRLPGNKETAESRKQAREHRHGGVTKVTSRGESGEPAGLRLGTRKTRGQPSGPAPSRGRARDSGPGECAPTCCRGGDRGIRLLSERVRGGTATNGQTGEARREVSRLTQSFLLACQGQRPGEGGSRGGAQTPGRRKGRHCPSLWSLLRGPWAEGQEGEVGSRRDAGSVLLKNCGWCGLGLREEPVSPHCKQIPGRLQTWLRGSWPPARPSVRGLQPHSVPGAGRRVAGGLYLCSPFVLFISGSPGGPGPLCLSLPTPRTATSMPRRSPAALLPKAAEDDGRPVPPRTRIGADA